VNVNGGVQFLNFFNCGPSLAADVRTRRALSLVVQGRLTGGLDIHFVNLTTTVGLSMNQVVTYALGRAMTAKTNIHGEGVTVFERAQYMFAVNMINACEGYALFPGGSLPFVVPSYEFLLKHVSIDVSSGSLLFRFTGNEVQNVLAFDCISTVCGPHAHLSVNGARLAPARFYTNRALNSMSVGDFTPGNFTTRLVNPFRAMVAMAGFTGSVAVSVDFGAFNTHCNIVCSRQLFNSASGFTARGSDFTVTHGAFWKMVVTKQFDVQNNPDDLNAKDGGVAG